MAMPDQPNTRVRALIVEDDPHVRRILRRILEGVATEVIECDSGSDAAGVFSSVMPDVVLMDIRLPGIDGISVTRQLRALSPPARIVIVTNHDEAALRRAALEAGACAYVLKENLLEVRSLLAGWFR